MKKYEELHSLITTLSKSEKRYFNLLFSRESKAANYLKLFNLIEKQVRYNEKEIKEAFAKDKFGEQIHVKKNYLKKMVLKSLRNYHSELSKNIALKEILVNVEILFNKELYQQCKSELLKADKIAKTYENITGIIEVNVWKRKLEQTLNPHSYDYFETLLYDQEKAINTLKKTNEYWSLAVKTSKMLIGRSGPTNNDEIKQISLKAETLEQEVMHANLAYLIHLNRNEVDEAENSLYGIINLLENESVRIKEDPGTYISSINNLLSYLIFINKHDDALNLLHKAKSQYKIWKLAT